MKTEDFFDHVVQEDEVFKMFVSERSIADDAFLFLVELFTVC